MDKEEQEKSKLFKSNLPLNNEENMKEKNRSMNPSIYLIKNKNNIEIDNQDKNSSKYLSQFYNVNKDLDENDEIDKNNIENKKKKLDINNRYNYFENNDEFEDDEISENNTPKEKPNMNKYDKKNLTDEKKKRKDLQISSEINKMMQSSNKKDINLLYKENEKADMDVDMDNDNNKVDENNKKDVNTKRKKEIEEIEKMIEKEYIPHRKFIEKSKFLIVLFSLGICVSLINSISCIYLGLFSNQDVLYIICNLSFFSIVIYIIWIIFILKDKNYVTLIINSKGNPEKINNSKYRKVIQLILYLIITILNYFVVFMLVNTLYLNNAKLSIKGKAYDFNQWIAYFNDKNYSKILQMYEESNRIFLIFGWINYLLMLFIYLYQCCLLINYRMIKSTLQLLFFLAIQGGICQIYLSAHCYVFRDITSEEGIKISWVTPGTMTTGCISILLGIFGFYFIFVEYKKGIFYLQIFCVIQTILLLIFTVCLGSIEDKFYNYKKAKCNSLFKFISEDYLIKNKYNGCNSKYLFTSETLTNMECPKDRIMINWERTEKLYNSLDTNSYDNDNDKSEDNKFINEDPKHIYFGCINQSCCLQLYYNIKNKFDLLFILSIHQITFFATIFFSCFYMNHKIGVIFEEEISEKASILIFSILTILIFLILLPFIVTLPNSSKQSQLNLIKNNEVSESLSIIHKDSTTINLEKLFQATNSSFYKVKNDIIKDFKYNLILSRVNNDSFNYKLSYYEYNFATKDLDIKIINEILEKINFNNFLSDYSNLTKTIKFRTESNIINNIFDYFDFIPKNLLKNNILLDIEINAIFTKTNNENENDDEIYKKTNDYKDIIIYEQNIIDNYNNDNSYSLINLINTQIDFSVMNKSEFFYIKGNILNDTGSSLINIYNYNYNNETIYSTTTNSKGEFIIGPIYQLINRNTAYNLNIKITKMPIVNDYNSISFCEYYNIIKIDNYSFQQREYYMINNIKLPEYKIGRMTIKGEVRQYNEKEDKDKLSYVNVKLFYGEKINKVLEYIEINSNNINSNSFDDTCIDNVFTNKDGEYSLKIETTGQYLILFIKEGYFTEKHLFTIDEIKEDYILNMGTMQLVEFFNSGKLVIKLEWDSKPPDLDLICRFQASKNLFCYTFFGNKKCGKTEFFQDNRLPDEISSEFIEISEFSDYLYLFYVRKYYDNSNGKTMNELRIEGVEDDKKMNFTEMYEINDKYLNDTSARIYIYSNGFKIPAITIPLPEFNEDIYDNNEEYIYWAAFCINGKEGINSLKIVNKYTKNEPGLNICKNFYDEDKISKF